MSAGRRGERKTFREGWASRPVFSPLAALASALGAALVALLALAACCYVVETQLGGSALPLLAAASEASASALPPLLGMARAVSAALVAVACLAVVRAVRNSGPTPSRAQVHERFGDLLSRDPISRGLLWEDVAWRVERDGSCFRIHFRIFGPGIDDRSVTAFARRTAQGMGVKKAYRIERIAADSFRRDGFQWELTLNFGEGETECPL